LRIVEIRDEQKRMEKEMPSTPTARLHLSHLILEGNEN
jgi:hypothetical protein